MKMYVWDIGKYDMRMQNFNLERVQNYSMYVEKRNSRK